MASIPVVRCLSQSTSSYLSHSPSLLTSTSTATPTIQEVPACPSFEDEFYFALELEDECPAPEVLLHITYEAVSQLDRAEESRLLSLDE
jgi:hypothetical protein